MPNEINMQNDLNVQKFGCASSGAGSDAGSIVSGSVAIGWTIATFKLDN